MLSHGRVGDGTVDEEMCPCAQDVEIGHLQGHVPRVYDNALGMNQSRDHNPFFFGEKIKTKGMGFKTILLSFVILLLVVSVSLMGYTLYLISAAANTDKVVDHFTARRKLFLIAPTVMNIMAMAVIAVLIMTR